MEKKTACKDDLEHYRMEYIAQTILEEKGQLVHLEAEVLKSIRENEIIAAHYYENDFKINLEAELEIRTLHEKVDHLLLIQWAKLMEIQELQIDILGEIKSELKKQ